MRVLEGLVVDPSFQCIVASAPRRCPAQILYSLCALFCALTFRNRASFALLMQIKPLMSGYRCSTGLWMATYCAVGPRGRWRERGPGRADARNRLRKASRPPQPLGYWVVCRREVLGASLGPPSVSPPVAASAVAQHAICLRSAAMRAARNVWPRLCGTACSLGICRDGRVRVTLSLSICDDVGDLACFGLSAILKIADCAG